MTPAKNGRPKAVLKRGKSFETRYTVRGGPEAKIFGYGRKSRRNVRG